MSNDALNRRLWESKCLGIFLQNTSREVVAVVIDGGGG